MPQVPGDLGYVWGKPDLERLGLFSEMPYMNGKGYVSPFERPKLEKGKNLIGEGPKIKAGRADYLFDKEFKRLFVGEAIKGRGRKQKAAVLRKAGPWMPTGITKWHSTPGDYHGCFSGNIEAFSNVRRRPSHKPKKEGKNLVTSPGKKGNAGYADITINRYPQHSEDKYAVKQKYKEYGRIIDGPFVSAHYPSPYFEKNPYADPPKMKPGRIYVPPKEPPVRLTAGKWAPNGPDKALGGCKAGGFNKFPEYTSTKYLSQHQIQNPPSKQKPRFGPWGPIPGGDKTLYTTSVVNENVRFRVNVNNVDTYQPTFTKYLL